ncbi:MAG: energy transducer TonB [Myxococcota bacterium]
MAALLNARDQGPPANLVLASAAHRFPEAFDNLPSRPPEPIHTEHPVFPAEAAQQAIEGTVVAKLWIDANGKVSKVEIVSATPPGVFEEAARAAFMKSTFSPAILNGEPVGSVAERLVRFHLKP